MTAISAVQPGMQRVMQRILGQAMLQVVEVPDSLLVSVCVYWLWLHAFAVWIAPEKPPMCVVFYISEGSSPGVTHKPFLGNK